MKLTTPHKFRERLLLVGGGGAGKTTCVLSVANAIADGHMYVVDNDYSAAYLRALATDFEDAAGQVTVVWCDPTWAEFITAVETIVERNNDEDNWLVLDSISPSWDAVQEWYGDLVYSSNLGGMMADLRKGANNQADYVKQLGEMMNWPAVKKEYSRLYRALQRWHGHVILTAEAKSIQGERDADLKAIYGPVGYKPAGEGRLHHVTSTTLFVKKQQVGVRSTWKFTTIKDRNRDEVENAPIEAIDEGGFADSYLREVAGWRPVRPAAKGTAKTVKTGGAK